MATSKKSFVLYVDQQDTFKDLPDEIAGKLIKLIYAYVNDENPEPEDLLLRTAFNPIKSQLKRDLKHWEDKRQKRAKAGQKGGLAKASNAKQNVANLAVSGNVNVNDTDSVRVILLTHSSWRDSVCKSKKIGKSEFKRLVELFLPNLKPENNESQQRRHFNSWLKYQEWKKDEEVIHSLTKAP